MKTKLAAILMTVAFAAACGGPADDIHELASQNRPIINGSDASDSFYDAVVSIHQTQGKSVYPGPFCTGTLITDSVVLTAAHCMEGQRPNKILVRVGETPTQVSATEFFASTYEATEILVHPAYDKFAIRNDIALIRLASPVSGVSPVPALPADTGAAIVAVGAHIDFAGFGQISANGPSGLRLHAFATIDGLGCTVTGCPGAGDAATQFSYDQDTGPCFGDSGGPAFIDDGSDTYVAGITSYGDSNCTVYGVSTRVDAFETFITDFIGGGSTPDPDPDPVVGCGDGVCTGGETCGSCPADCEISHPKKGVLACCGDGVCSNRETATQCPADCG